LFILFLTECANIMSWSTSASVPVRNHSMWAQWHGVNIERKCQKKILNFLWNFR
jgi:hypothetical protein